MKIWRRMIFLLAATMTFLPNGISSALADGPSGTTTGGAPAATGENCLLNDQDLAHFPPAFSGSIPHDAYDPSSAMGEKLQAAKKGKCHADHLKVQRLYDIFSWQSFLALNWPVDSASTNGAAQPTARFTDEGPPQWTTWMEAHQVFKDDGSAPDPWTARPQTVRTLSEITQAFSFPLWDQNGTPVYYEMLLNEYEYKYIYKNRLYNQEGQTQFLNKGNKVVFGTGSTTTPERQGLIGPIEVKLAWKVLGREDLPERFFKMQALIPDGTGKTKSVDVGLVGMHITHKTGSSNQWVWSTFEHVDNVRVNDLEALALAKQGKNLKPLFYNPSCPTCPANEPLHRQPKENRGTQVTRVIPISSLTSDLNSEVQQLLRQLGSKWQYYELVGTQYATNPSLGPTAELKGVESITNHSGGAPTPAYLANTVLETYFQKGNQESPLVSKTGNVQIFETASCMSCHFDAGLLMIVNNQAINIPGTADFSWLFSLAKPKTQQTQLLYRNSPLKD